MKHEAKKTTLTFKDLEGNLYKRSETDKVIRNYYTRFLSSRKDYQPIVIRDSYLYRNMNIILNPSNLIIEMNNGFVQSNKVDKKSINIKVKNVMIEVVEREIYHYYEI